MQTSFYFIPPINNRVETSLSRVPEHAMVSVCLTITGLILDLTSTGKRNGVKEFGKSGFTIFTVARIHSSFIRKTKPQRIRQEIRFRISVSSKSASSRSFHQLHIVSVSS